MTGSDGADESRFPPGDVVSAEREAAGVRVRFGGGVVMLSSDWLRDNCWCASCRIVQTDERRYQPWIDEDPVVVAAVDVIDGALIVTWRDGHRSRFEAATFHAIEGAMTRDRLAQQLWAADHDLERIDHDAATTDGVVRRRLFESFLRDGAVVVVGARRRPGGVVDFLAALGIPLRELSLGRVFDVLVDPTGYNVAYTAEAIPPHNDNAQSTHPPSGQVLSMLVNDATGGDSIVVDGWSVLRQLADADPAAVDVLCRVAVGFRQYSADADGHTRMPLVTRDADGGFSHLRFSNQLRQPLAFDHPELGAWYAAYRSLGRLIVEPTNQIRFRLEGGEMLIVNGLRILHGRTAFRPDGPRHLQDVYFDVDDLVGRLARLTGAAPNAMVTS